jgi:hypothetical protein
MMVYRLLSCLYVLCVVALLTFWSVQDYKIVYILHEQYKIYMRQDTRKKMHSPRTLQNVSNAITHKTYKQLNNLYTIIK